MIPQRVKLRGFLCYKDEQEVSFDGSTLWMLSGLNGSGKSAVFDAVTFALFGYHRGGSTGAQELINKHSNGFEVEFDFLQDKHTYRLHRTLKRKPRGGTHATQQVYQRTSGNGTPVGTWIPVANTTRRSDFASWIHNIIGLNYETFTSSVLLLQGKAEKLLDSTAKGRSEVLAGVVGLERYQKLQEKADDRRRVCEGRVKSLRERLENSSEISQAELLAAQAVVDAADNLRSRARSEVERLQALEIEAKQWLEKSERLLQIREKMGASIALLDEANEIERDENRLKELKAVLPAVKNAMEQRRGIEEAERKLEKLAQQHKSIEVELERHECEIEKFRQARAKHQSSLQRDENRNREVASELRDAATLVEKLKEVERQEHELGLLQKDIKTLPADPAKEVQHLQAERERLVITVQAVPLLQRLFDVREQLRTEMERGKTGVKEKQQIEERGKKLKSEVERIQQQLDEAEKIRRSADDELTEARTLRKQAEQEVHELLTLRGSKICRQCGQQLTKAHLHAEKQRRDRNAADAKEKYQKLLKRQQIAATSEEQLRKQLDAAVMKYQDARADYRTCLQRAEQSAKDVARLRQECKRIYQELPADYRRRISPQLPADWLTTTYPNLDDVRDLGQQEEELDSLQKRARDAESALNKWNQLKVQENTLIQSVRRRQGELPPDRDQLRQRYADLVSEDDSLQKNIDALRSALLSNQTTADRLAQQREKIQRDLGACQANQQTESATANACRHSLDRSLKDLPVDWKQQIASAGMGDLYTWERQRDQLAQKGTEQRAEELRQARAATQGLKDEQAELEERLQQFPNEAKMGPSAIRQQLGKARDEETEADKKLSRARQDLARLENDKTQREQCLQEFLQADRERTRAKLLAESLGRDRLQLYLVRQAERQVVDHANAVLDRLSGGELYLRLSGEAGGEANSAKALELEAHNRITGEEPINVAFLSGSQKFRVSVGLALGIGQYASRRHRAIESVIIDEGFGCLDKNGRQVMIQELQNLRSQMRCILLVSHQEEIADAFSDGYYFELQNGTTVARRFQR